MYYRAESRKMTTRQIGDTNGVIKSVVAGKPRAIEERFGGGEEAEPIWKEQTQDDA